MSTLRLTLVGTVILTLFGAVGVAAECQEQLAASTRPDPSPRGSAAMEAERFPTMSGWVQVRLVGSPQEIGFQHGVLLAAEITDGLLAVKPIATKYAGRDWDWFREAAREVIWPGVDPEYQAEMQGIADGLQSEGVDLDVWDITALNAWLELAWTWAPLAPATSGASAGSTMRDPGHCSAFVATGSYTADGGVVVAHNTWVDYAVGERWRILFDIRPESGHRFFMDGFPGMIHSASDFGVNSAGLIITETSLPTLKVYDPAGIPEFSRARQAMQYASSIDDFVRIMQDGNNGGYANTWLVADRASGEIASLELGLHNVTLERTTDGYFVGSNFATDPELIANEVWGFDSYDPGSSPNARRARWMELMEANKGQIDLEMAQTFLGDIHDVVLDEDGPNERTLCGRIDLSPRGWPGFQMPYAPAGTTQNKAIDATLAGEMTLTAAYGPQCGPAFEAEPFLAEHPTYAWQAPFLEDMPREEWTRFEAAP
jgi:hypothetical protein